MSAALEVARPGLGASRQDIPCGQLPCYADFVKTVWRWRDDEGRSALDTPPWMYTIFVTEDIEVVMIGGLVQTLCRMLPEASEKIEVRTLDDGTEFSFAGLEPLHAFLNLLVTIGVKNDTARRVAEYMLWTLGFRWV